jgi:hypothetical protein
MLHFVPLCSFARRRFSHPRATREEAARYIVGWPTLRRLKLCNAPGRDPSVNQRRWNSTRRRKFLTYVFVMKCRNAEMGPFACFIRCFDLRSEFMRNKRPHTFICALGSRQQSGGIFLIKNFILRECPSLFLSH